MANITAEQSCPLAPAFLDLIAWCEGTSRSKLTRDDGYDIIVGGRPPSAGVETFTDYSRHPFANGERKAKYIGVFDGKPVHSDAAGRYQIILPTWRAVSREAALRDFSPLSQDLAAVELLRQAHDASGSAYDHLADGKLLYAIKLAAQVWASLPGSAAGQRGPGSPNLGNCVAKFAEFQAAYASQPKGGTTV